MDLHSLLGIILVAAIPIVGGGLVWVFAQGARFLAEKAKGNAVWGLTLKLYETASSIVSHVEVSMREPLKSALADGRISAAEATMLKTTALRLFKEALGEAGLAQVQKLLGLSAPAVDVHLSGLIERALDVKQAAAAAQPGSIAAARAAVDRVFPMSGDK